MTDALTTPPAAPAGLPPFDEFIPPTLKALENLGGSAQTDELTAEIAKIMGLSDEVLNILVEVSKIHHTL